MPADYLDSDCCPYPPEHSALCECRRCTEKNHELQKTKLKQQRKARRLQPCPACAEKDAEMARLQRELADLHWQASAQSQRAVAAESDVAGLEAVLRALLSDPPHYQHEGSAVHRCWWCDMPTDAHAVGCRLRRAYTALGGE